MGKKVSKILLVIFAVLAVIILAVLGAFSWVNRTNGKIVSGGETRKFLLYVPPSYDSSVPTSLIISMHGFIEWPAHQQDISNWNDLADEYGFIVVYPQGTGFPLRWNASAQPDAANDVQFISDLIDQLSEEYNLDQKRIFANGLSNGGGMSYLLACDLSERIAAIGGVAGAYHLSAEECTPPRPVPVIAFHGTADKIVPYEGTVDPRSNFAFPAISDWAKTWADRNGCDPTSIELPPNGEVTGVIYSGCSQNADVIFYTIHGGGHTWPGGDSMPEFIVGHTTQDIDASEEMWKFFQEHPFP